jgi:hypothetical protein
MSLSQRRLLAAIITPLVFTACGSVRPPQPPTLDLPKPPTDLRATRKGDKVILTWTVPTVTTDHQTARSFGSTRICRGFEPKLEKCTAPVGQAAAVKQASKTSSQTKSSKQKATASYSDILPATMLADGPNRSATYAVEVLNADGQGAGLSNQVHILLASTPPAPGDFSARVTAQGVVLAWNGNALSATPQSTRYLYRVYRRPEGTQQQGLAGELANDGKNSFSFTDSNIEWQKTYEYHVEAVTVIAQPNKPEVQVDGDDTPEIKVFADDVFPPAVPSNLQAVFSGPGQQLFVDLIWAPDADADLDGYNVYRREEGTSPEKVNKELVKTPAYRDMAVTSGKRYLYSVTAVDLRGNESVHSDEAGESVP